MRDTAKITVTKEMVQELLEKYGKIHAGEARYRAVTPTPLQVLEKICGTMEYAMAFAIGSERDEQAMSPIVARTAYAMVSAAMASTMLEELVGLEVEAWLMQELITPDGLSLIP